MENRLKIKGNKIFDARNKLFFSGIITIEEGKITEVKKLKHQPSEPVKEQCSIIDAGDYIVSPGFIDVHSHEDLLDDSPMCQVAEDMVRMGVTTCVAGNCGTMFQPLDKFLSHINQYGTPVNYVFFTGYNAHRKEAGVNLYDSCPKEKMNEIAERINKDLLQGAMGLSFGLEYAPGIDLAEIETIISRLGKTDLKISVHIRDDKEASIAAVQEAIEIGRRTKLPIFISHIGSMSAYGQMRKVYELIEQAGNQGFSVYVDCYPYNAFATRIGSAVFDEKSMAEGKFSYDQIMFATGPFAGKYCNEQLYMEARTKYPESFAIGFGMSEDEICYAYTRNETMISSDGFVLGHQGHPRTAGSFPRVLGKYVRDDRVLKLEEALYKMTLKPAMAVGLKKKGLIEPGNDADLVIFDSYTIADKADFTHVNEPPEGIKAVIVNGRISVSEKQINGRYGRFIPLSEF